MSVERLTVPTKSKLYPKHPPDGLLPAVIERLPEPDDPHAHPGLHGSKGSLEARGNPAVRKTFAKSKLHAGSLLRR